MPNNVPRFVFLQRGNVKINEFFSGHEGVPVGGRCLNTTRRLFPANAILGNKILHPPS